MLSFSRKTPMLLLSTLARSVSITRKPAASEAPKSPSPARASRSEKCFSFLSTVAETALMVRSTTSIEMSLIVQSPNDAGETHHAATLDASWARSPRVMRTFGASPSSGTTAAAPVKSSSVV